MFCLIAAVDAVSGWKCQVLWIDGGYSRVNDMCVVQQLLLLENTRTPSTPVFNTTSLCDTATTTTEKQSTVQYMCIGHYPGRAPISSELALLNGKKNLLTLFLILTPTLTIAVY